jgi:hypothetical protein
LLLAYQELINSLELEAKSKPNAGFASKKEIS